MGGICGGGMGSPRLAAIWPVMVVGANMDLEVGVERGQEAADVSLPDLIAHKTSVNPPPRHSHDARPRSGLIHACEVAEERRAKEATNRGPAGLEYGLEARPMRPASSHAPALHPSGAPVGFPWRPFGKVR